MDFVSSRHVHNNNNDITTTDETVPRNYRNKMSNIMYTLMNQKPIKHVTNCTTATIRKTLSYPTSNYSNTNHNRIITRYDLIKAASEKEQTQNNKKRNRTRRSSN